MMVTATLQEAKAKLNSLIDAALRGEDVVFLRGSKVVVRLQPITEAELEIAPQLTDTQAERFWKEVGKTSAKTFSTSTRAVRFLKNSHRS